ncbi:hypothetical protein MAPG_09504 [Magnaporthiopsis poae ATCC 64411]|uniref:DNA-binding protein n=1 Tax=Magnaporthiopsis poae (strain ATCC 64411 / 73-15) TaxID=644358 RepID=A0A0C4EA46_MAGP6|nr:hypothetical protein MAPG_09504 [Magnaporthiopsis poae ATCC 64411]
MGNEGSKPVVEEGATVFDNVQRDLTPPPGTGRYADDGIVKAEPGTSSPLASSLNVGVPDKPGAIQFHHGLPAPSSPERKHVISASNPEFQHELPHLSSPNRVRPPSPPPATEPAPFAMPDIIDGLARLPISSPSEKKPTVSRKKRRASATLSQNPDGEPASPPPASSAASVDAATPQGLTRAQRKELKRQHRLARKSGATLADFSPSLNGAGAGDTIPEKSLPARQPGASTDFPFSLNGAGAGDASPEESLPVRQSEDDFDATQTTASSAKKKRRHGKRTINGQQMSTLEGRSAESTDQHQEVVNGVDLPHGGTEEEEAVAAPHQNAARDTPIDSGDESGALLKREQTPETSPRAERKPKKSRKTKVAHENGINGSPPRSGTPRAQATGEDIPDAPITEAPAAPETETPQLSEALGVVNGRLETTSPDRHSPPAFSTLPEPPSTVKRRKRKDELRSLNPRDAEGDGVSTPKPTRPEHMAEEDMTEPRVEPLAPEDVSANLVAAATTPPALGSLDRDPQPPAQSPLPHAPASDAQPSEELLDEAVINSLGSSFRPINGSPATCEWYNAAAKATPGADLAIGDAIVPRPKIQAPRKRQRKPVNRELQVEAAAAGTPASAEGSPNQNAPTSERHGGDDATDGAGSREELEPNRNHGNQAPETSQSRRASARKRVSKPSYFESEARANKEALEQLPAPEATTPARRPQRTARTVPPNRTSAGPPEKGKQKENRSKGDYASGPFTAQENAAIQRAVEEFRAEHDMSQQAINTMIHQNPVGSGSTDLHRELWEKVAPACPRRRRQKIILRARALFHNFVGRGVFTPEQDQELRELVEKMGQKWAEIGRIVDRNPLDLRDRWRNYAVCGDKKKAETWEENEVSRLTDLVVDAINTILRSRGQDFSSEESREQAERDVAWDVISKHMDRTRSAKQCREKWVLLQARRAQNSDGSGNEDDVVTRALEKMRADLRKMTPSDKHTLIKAIHMTEVTTDEKIPWAKLGDAAFQKRWNRDTLRIMWSRLRPTIPGHEHLNTRNVAQALLDSYDKDQVLTQLEDVDVDDKMEASILGVVSKKKKKSRASRKSSASGVTASRPKKRKRQDAEEGDRGQEDSGGEGASNGSAKRTKTPKRRRIREGLGATRRLSAQISSFGSQLQRPGSSAGIQLSSQFVENSDDSGDEEQRARSPEVPASPERPERLTPREKAAAEPPQLDNDEVTDSQVPMDGNGEDDGEDDESDVRAETESVDLGAQPGSTEKRDGIRNGVGTAEDIVSEVEAQVEEEASIAAASSRKRRASQTFSPAFAHDRFKKQRSSMQTYSSKKAPRTPFSARRRTFADVYDDIEEAHGESSQPGPTASAKMGTDERRGASAQHESIADQTGEGNKLVALEGDSDSGGEGVPATLPKFPPRNPENAFDSEAERRRLAEESDEDSDMEDIPARLPGSAEEESE